MQEPEDTDIDDDIDVDEDPLFYVESATQLIFEVKFFGTFCLVRPATPELYGYLRKVSHVEFAEQFVEFLGDRDALLAYFNGAAPDLLIEVN